MCTVDAGRGTRLGSESLRSGVPDGLRRRGDPGLEEKPTLLLREAKEKRPPEAAGLSAGVALVAEGVSSLSVDVGNVASAGEDDRFTGRAFSKPFDGRLLGEGACIDVRRGICQRERTCDENTASRKSKKK